MNKNEGGVADITLFIREGAEIGVEARALKDGLILNIKSGRNELTLFLAEEIGKDIYHGLARYYEAKANTQPTEENND